MPKYLELQPGEPVGTPRIRRSALMCQHIRLPGMTVGTRDFSMNNAGRFLIYITYKGVVL